MSAVRRDHLLHGTKDHIRTNAKLPMFTPCTTLPARKHVFVGDGGHSSDAPAEDTIERIMLKYNMRPFKKIEKDHKPSFVSTAELRAK